MRLDAIAITTSFRQLIAQSVKLPPLSVESCIKEALRIFIDNPTINLLPVVKPNTSEMIGCIYYLDVLRLLCDCHDGGACTYDLLKVLRSSPVFDTSKSYTENRDVIIRSMEEELSIIAASSDQYVGIIPSREVVRYVYEENIVAAQAQNPLTGLPGNVSIRRQFQEYASKGGALRFCYIDINNFKPFNDHFGVPKGDDVIKFTASLLIQNARKFDGWVGHVGGDDFVILAKDDNIVALCESIIDDFEAGKRSYYDEVDLRRGYVLAKTREGKLKNFPFIGLCVAVSNIIGEGVAYEQVGAAVAAFKNQIKEEEGGRSAYRIDRRAFRSGAGAGTTHFFGS